MAEIIEQVPITLEVDRYIRYIHEFIIKRH